MHRKPHDHPDFDRAGGDVRRPEAPPTFDTSGQITTADPNATHPVAGIPQDAEGFLAFLKAGVFTPEQLRYLHSNALSTYEGSPAFATSAKAQEIAAAWRAALAAACMDIGAQGQWPLTRANAK